ncbi:phosphotyrosine protein phosphatases I [Ramicandelaber brevisporus]|nr:phosphotyrosine protein phosphatases I [Ramicandelaber brevisporus]
MTAARKEPISVLFVCLGNICRSPMAEAVFAKTVSDLGLDAHFARIDSAGTSGEHDDETSDSRTIATCKKNGVPITSISRKITKEDFYDFDYILCADKYNLRDLKDLEGRINNSQKQKNRSAGELKTKAVVQMFGYYKPDRLANEAAETMPDPWYDFSKSHKAFDVTYEQSVRFSKGFLQHLELVD